MEINPEQIKTIRNHIEFHQRELNKALQELYDEITDSADKPMVEKGTTRDRILSVLSDGQMYTARQIKLVLVARGIGAAHVDQHLVGMEKDGLVASDRTAKRKKYFTGPKKIEVHTG